MSCSSTGRRPWSACALVILLALPIAAFADAAPKTITLAEAMRRTLHNNPELEVFAWRQHGLRGEIRTASQSAGYQLDLDAENIGRNSDELEITLAISSVIELGNKRGTRTAVAESRLALSQSERQAAALDLLGSLTQRFIAVLALQEKLKVMEEASELAQSSQHLLRRRLEHGAVAEADVLRAEAALVQAQLRQQAMAAQLVSSKVALAVLWGGREVDFAAVEGTLFGFAEVASFDELYKRAATGPAIQVFADEARLREAELELVRVRSKTDIQWRAGIRQFGGTDDTALVAGLSIPLSASARNRGEVQAARAERQLVDHRREAALLSLHATLFDAWQSHQQGVQVVAQLRERVLPVLTRALEQTRQAYESGRYSYVEWAGIQQEFLEAKMALIDAATTALLQQALIEHLTAEPLASSTFAPIQD